MDVRNQKLNRAPLLLKQIEPELLKLLENAPDFGSCGVDVTLCQGEVIRISVRAEVTRKLKPKGSNTP